MATKVMVSFPDEFLAKVERIAQDEHRSRSELLREALRLYIGMRPGARRPGEDPAVRRAVILQDSLSRLAPGEGEDSAIDVRNWREAH
jgi:metal-responsive CopG/Arc/MetJ family transcriptional regulator